ncbi:MAG TPA: sn-glycerol-3-phosphate ABC transporter ATP-binding protein UgpC [Elusimicrobiota bacterium]|nr:sn-glycerol-3-phosphate ABC transporter ATP-binding protein UgpC [Elusimicrobiota bacterium]
MARVDLKNVAKKFGDHYVVKNVNLEIPDKEFFILVGPSGCGKSTTLRMIAGLEEASEGTVSINGQVVNDVPPKDRDIAMVFQNYALYPHMTVYENMAFGLKLRRYPKSEIDRRVREAAEILNLGPLLQRKPKALSGGQRQRVAVGRAIVRKPHVFLFDEPLSNLDAKLRVQMRVELSKLHDRLQTTMIYVTHDQVEAMTMGDRICVMKDGEIQQVAPPLELYHKPANQFVAGFIGNPPMNFFPVRIEKNKDGVWLRHEAFSLAAPAATADKIRPRVGQEAVLGIRPEDIYDRLFYSSQVPEGSTVKAVVEVLEPMGSEIYLYLKAGKTDVVARMPPYVKTKLHQEIELVFNLERLHLFDKETGVSLL